VSVSQADEAEALGNRIIQLMSQPYDIDGHQVIVGTSVGIAMASSALMTADQLARNADMALYRAKGDGRGNLRFFHPEMDAKMQERRALEDDLRNALTNNELELHYQPIVGTNDNEICCVEALIRWRHPDRGLLAPTSFVGLAEEIGLTIRIGEWALREACQRAAQWPEHIAVAVNLSPRQFGDAELLQTVLDTLAETGLAAHRLEVEITETSLLQDSGSTLATLYRLRELGICIALDDFGTGYSSLSYLQCFPFDRIKIDRSFIDDIADGIGSLSIVRAVIGLAKNLGMKTTAEGVETQAQVALLHSEGCTEMQGFFFSKPLPAQEIDQLLSSNRTADLPRVA
jgi:predicted signal transduction protein with EAL and GGDEF domain